MSALNIPCSICLKPEDSLIKITEIDENNQNWLTKLETLIPELTWNKNYQLCQNCAGQIDDFLQFRIECIRLDTRRKSTLITKEEESIVYTCFHCQNGFTDKKTLESHIITQHTQQNKSTHHQCETCTKQFRLKKTYQAHQKTCCVEKPKKRRTFSCEICNITSEYAKNIVEHCVGEHQMEAKAVKPYTCDQCPMRFSSSANLIQHKKYHDGSRGHICSFCGKTYITKSDLTVHEYTHFNRRNYKCEDCDKAFNTNKNLRSHKLVVHTDAELWKYECTLCNRRFPLKSGFEQHMRRHSGDKRFICHICNKPFVSRSELQKHMGFHSKVKPFRCMHCSRSYKERRVLEAHLSKSHGIGEMKQPTRERKFTCHLCPSKFFDRQKLTRHLYTHSGEKPFGCHECDKKYTDKYYLKQHLKTVHQLGPTEDNQQHYKQEQT